MRILQRFFEEFLRLSEVLQIEIADGLVVGDLPVALDDLLGLVVDVDGGFMPRHQEEASGHLLVVVRRLGIQQRASLKQVQRLLNLAFLA